MELVESIEAQFEKYPVTLSTVEHYIKQWERAVKSIKFKQLNPAVKVLVKPENYCLSVWARSNQGGCNTQEKIVGRDVTLMKQHIANLKQLREFLLKNPTTLF